MIPNRMIYLTLPLVTIFLCPQIADGLQLPFCQSL